MVQFQHVLTLANGPESHLVGTTDMLAVMTEAGVRLVSTTGPGGGVVMRDPAAGMAVGNVISLPATGALTAPLHLSVTEFEGHLTMFVAGRATGGLTGYRVQPDGRLSTGFELPVAPGSPIASIQTLEIIDLGGRQLFFTSARDVPGLTLWERDSAGQLRVVEQISVGVGGGSVTDLAQVTLGGQTHLLGLSQSNNTLSNFHVATNGTVRLVDTVDMRDGMSIQTPTHLETVVSAGVTYGLIGAAGSSSITVVALGADGRMRVTDQVNDDLDTRFQGISILKTVVVEGQAFVLAGGADDGLTLMTLLPGGRLLALATLADDLAMGLTNPVAADLWVADGRIEIAVIGEGAAGVTRLSVDPTPGSAPGQVHVMGSGGGSFSDGAGSSQIIGGAGSDHLFGNGGNDILVDGAGSDTLTGGAGADVFVFTRDGVGDIIEDFEPGIDRMDLSALGLFYTVNSLSITSTSNGARIQVGDEWVQVNSANGRALTAADFDISDLRDLWHIPVAALPDPNRVLQGTVLNDLLLGGSGQDTLIGGRGDDRLIGAEGNDLLIGEARDAVFDDTAADVFRLYQATLNRAPDVTGHLTWVDRLTNGGMTLDQAASGFVASAEFQARYGAANTPEFVTLLYQNVLGRSPDAGGFATWSTRLDSGDWTRSEVVIGFAQSLEFRSATAADVLNFSRAGYAADRADDVFRLYQATLGRTPDEGGLLNWAEALANGRPFLDVVGGFVASAEFRGRYGDTTNEEFVTLLYANVLGRTPDAIGFASWTTRLNSGDWTRAEVVQGFSQSREFVLNTTPNLIAWKLALGPNDELVGGAGANVLFGGILSDHFVFTVDAGARHDVADLEPWDRIDLSDFGYADAQSARDHLTQRGRDVVFADDGVSVIFHDTTLAAFHDGLFIL